MKALICVFSGTGNTLRVCERVSQELRKYDVEVDIYSICQGTAMPKTAEYDMLLIAYPVHAFNAPTPIFCLLKKIPNGNGKPAYLLRTSGEPLRLNHASGTAPRRLLEKKGYMLRGEFAYVMPYNIIFRHSDGMAARMWRAAELRIKVDAKQIAEGQCNKNKVNIIKRFVAFVLRVEHTAMPILGRRFRATDLCVGCEICQKKCPQKNITMKNGKPEFGKNCVGCMACAFSCPKDAIKISVLNGWRVNGSYSFDGIPVQDEDVCSYCKKAYLRYFHESEATQDDSL